MQINNEEHTRITRWVKFKSLERSVFALEIRESLRTNMLAHRPDVHLRFVGLQLFRDLFFLNKNTCGRHAATTNDFVKLSLLIARFRLLLRFRQDQTTTEIQRWNLFYAKYW